jgi:hypothetical protein
VMIHSVNCVIDWMLPSQRNHVTKPSDLKEGKGPKTFAELTPPMRVMVLFMSAYVDVIVSWRFPTHTTVMLCHARCPLIQATIKHAGLGLSAWWRGPEDDIDLPADTAVSMTDADLSAGLHGTVAHLDAAAVGVRYSVGGVKVGRVFSCMSEACG